MRHLRAVERDEDMSFSEQRSFVFVETYTLKVHSSIKVKKLKKEKDEDVYGQRLGIKNSSFFYQYLRYFILQHRNR